MVTRKDKQRGLQYLISKYDGAPKKIYYPEISQSFADLFSSVYCYTDPTHGHGYDLSFPASYLEAILFGGKKLMHLRLRSNLHKYKRQTTRYSRTKLTNYSLLIRYAGF